jgi:hypothetical protein
MENCECEIYWALCPENDCPRAERIRALQDAAEEKKRELLDLDRPAVLQSATHAVQEKTRLPGARRQRAIPRPVQDSFPTNSSRLIPRRGTGRGAFRLKVFPAQRPDGSLKESERPR